MSSKKLNKSSGGKSVIKLSSSNSTPQTARKSKIRLSSAPPSDDQSMQKQRNSSDNKDNITSKAVVTIRQKRGSASDHDSDSSASAFSQSTKQTSDYMSYQSGDSDSVFSPAGDAENVSYSDGRPNPSKIVINVSKKDKKDKCKYRYRSLESSPGSSRHTTPNNTLPRKSKIRISSKSPSQHSSDRSTPQDLQLEQQQQQSSTDHHRHFSEQLDDKIRKSSIRRVSASRLKSESTSPSHELTVENLQAHTSSQETVKEPALAKLSFNELVSSLQEKYNVKPDDGAPMMTPYLHSLRDLASTITDTFSRTITPDEQLYNTDKFMNRESKRADRRRHRENRGRSRDKVNSRNRSTENIERELEDRGTAEIDFESERRDCLSPLRSSSPVRMVSVSNSRTITQDSHEELASLISNNTNADLEPEIQKKLNTLERKQHNAMKLEQKKLEAQKENKRLEARIPRQDSSRRDRDRDRDIPDELKEQMRKLEEQKLEAQIMDRERALKEKLERKHEKEIYEQQKRNVQMQKDRERLEMKIRDKERAEERKMQQKRMEKETTDKLEEAAKKLEQKTQERLLREEQVRKQREELELKKKNRQRMIEKLQREEEEMQKRRAQDLLEREERQKREEQAARQKKLQEERLREKEEIELILEQKQILRQKMIEEKKLKVQQEMEKQKLEETQELDRSRVEEEKQQQQQQSFQQEHHLTQEIQDQGQIQHSKQIQIEDQHPGHADTKHSEQTEDKHHPEHNEDKNNSNEEYESRKTSSRGPKSSKLKQMQQNHKKQQQQQQQQKQEQMQQCEKELELKEEDQREEVVEEELTPVKSPKSPKPSSTLKQMQQKHRKQQELQKKIQHEQNSIQEEGQSSPEKPPVEECEIEKENKSFHSERNTREDDFDIVHKEKDSFHNTSVHQVQSTDDGSCSIAEQVRKQREELELKKKNRQKMMEQLQRQEEEEQKQRAQDLLEREMRKKREEQAVRHKKLVDADERVSLQQAPACPISQAERTDARKRSERAQSKNPVIEEVMDVRILEDVQMEINFDAISQTFEDEIFAHWPLEISEFDGEEEGEETENELEQAVKGTRISRIFVKTSSEEEDDEVEGQENYTDTSDEEEAHESENELDQESENELEQADKGTRSRRMCVKTSSEEEGEEEEVEEEGDGEQQGHEQDNESSDDQESLEAENQFEQALAGTRASRTFVKTSSSEYVSSGEEEKKLDSEKLDSKIDLEPSEMKSEKFHSSGERNADEKFEPVVYSQQNIPNKCDDTNEKENEKNEQKNEQINEQKIEQKNEQINELNTADSQNNQNDIQQTILLPQDLPPMVPPQNEILPTGISTIDTNTTDDVVSSTLETFEENTVTTPNVESLSKSNNSFDQNNLQLINIEDQKRKCIESKPEVKKETETPENQSAPFALKKSFGAAAIKALEAQRRSMASQVKVSKPTNSMQRTPMKKVESKAKPAFPWKRVAETKVEKKAPPPEFVQKAVEMKSVSFADVVVATLVDETEASDEKTPADENTPADETSQSAESQIAINDIDQNEAIQEENSLSKPIAEDKSSISTPITNETSISTPISDENSSITKSVSKKKTSILIEDSKDSQNVRFSPEVSTFRSDSQATLRSDSQASIQSCTTDTSTAQETSESEESATESDQIDEPVLQRSRTACRRVATSSDESDHIVLSEDDDSDSEDTSESEEGDTPVTPHWVTALESALPERSADSESKSTSEIKNKPQIELPNEEIVDISKFKLKKVSKSENKNKPPEPEAEKKSGSMFALKKFAGSAIKALEAQRRNQKLQESMLTSKKQTGPTRPNKTTEAAKGGRPKFPWRKDEDTGQTDKRKDTAIPKVALKNIYEKPAVEIPTEEDLPTIEQNVDDDTITEGSIKEDDDSGEKSLENFPLTSFVNVVIAKVCEVIDDSNKICETDEIDTFVNIEKETPTQETLLENESAQERGEEAKVTSSQERRKPTEDSETGSESFEVVEGRVDDMSSVSQQVDSSASSTATEQIMIRSPHVSIESNTNSLPKTTPDTISIPVVDNETANDASSDFHENENILDGYSVIDMKIDSTGDTQMISKTKNEKSEISEPTDKPSAFKLQSLGDIVSHLMDVPGRADPDGTTSPVARVIQAEADKLDPSSAEAKSLNEIQNFMKKRSFTPEPIPEPAADESPVLLKKFSRSAFKALEAQKRANIGKLSQTNLKPNKTAPTTRPAKKAEENGTKKTIFPWRREEEKKPEAESINKVNFNIKLKSVALSLTPEDEIQEDIGEKQIVDEELVQASEEYKVSDPPVMRADELFSVFSPDSFFKKNEEDIKIESLETQPKPKTPTPSNFGFSNIVLAAMNGEPKGTGASTLKRPRSRKKRTHKENLYKAGIEQISQSSGSDSAEEAENQMQRAEELNEKDLLKLRKTLKRRSSINEEEALQPAIERKETPSFKMVKLKSSKCETPEDLQEQQRAASAELEPEWKAIKLCKRSENETEMESPKPKEDSNLEFKKIVLKASFVPTMTSPQNEREEESCPIFEEAEDQNQGRKSVAEDIFALLQDSQKIGLTSASEASGDEVGVEKVSEGEVSSRDSGDLHQMKVSQKDETTDSQSKQRLETLREGYRKQRGESTDSVDSNASMSDQQKLRQQRQDAVQLARQKVRNYLALSQDDLTGRKPRSRLGSRSRSRSSFDSEDEQEATFEENRLTPLLKTERRREKLIRKVSHSFTSSSDNDAIDHDLLSARLLEVDDESIERIYTAVLDKGYFREDILKEVIIEEIRCDSRIVEGDGNLDEVVLDAKEVMSTDGRCTAEIEEDVVAEDLMVEMRTDSRLVKSEVGELKEVKAEIHSQDISQETAEMASNQVDRVMSPAPEVGMVKGLEEMIRKPVNNADIVRLIRARHYRTSISDMSENELRKQHVFSDSEQINQLFTNETEYDARPTKQARHKKQERQEARQIVMESRQMQIQHWREQIEKRKQERALVDADRLAEKEKSAKVEMKEMWIAKMDLRRREKEKELEAEKTFEEEEKQDEEKYNSTEQVDTGKEDIPNDETNTGAEITPRVKSKQKLIKSKERKLSSGSDVSASSFTSKDFICSEKISKSDEKQRGSPSKKGQVKSFPGRKISPELTEDTRQQQQQKSSSKKPVPPTTKPKPKVERVNKEKPSDKDASAVKVEASSGKQSKVPPTTKPKPKSKPKQTKEQQKKQNLLKEDEKIDKVKEGQQKRKEKSPPPKSPKPTTALKQTQQKQRKLKQQQKGQEQQAEEAILRDASSTSSDNIPSFNEARLRFGTRTPDDQTIKPTEPKTSSETKTTQKSAPPPVTKPKPSKQDIPHVNDTQESGFVTGASPETSPELLKREFNREREGEEDQEDSEIIGLVQDEPDEENLHDGSGRKTSLIELRKSLKPSASTTLTSSSGDSGRSSPLFSPAAELKRIRQRSRDRSSSRASATPPPEEASSTTPEEEDTPVKLRSSRITRARISPSPELHPDNESSSLEGSGRPARSRRGEKRIPRLIEEELATIEAAESSSTDSSMGTAFSLLSAQIRKVSPENSKAELGKVENIIPQGEIVSRFFEGEDNLRGLDTSSTAFSQDENKIVELAREISESFQKSSLEIVADEKKDAEKFVDDITASRERVVVDEVGEEATEEGEQELAEESKEAISKEEDKEEEEKSISLKTTAFDFLSLLSPEDQSFFASSIEAPCPSTVQRDRVTEIESISPDLVLTTSVHDADVAVISDQHSVVTEAIRPEQMRQSEVDKLVMPGDIDVAKTPEDSNEFKQMSWPKLRSTKKQAPSPDIRSRSPSPVRQEMQKMKLRAVEKVEPKPVVDELADMPELFKKKRQEADLTAVTTHEPKLGQFSFDEDAENWEEIYDMACDLLDDFDIPSTRERLENKQKENGAATETSTKPKSRPNSNLFRNMADVVSAAIDFQDEDKTDEERDTLKIKLGAKLASIPKLVVQLSDEEEKATFKIRRKKQSDPEPPSAIFGELNDDEYFQRKIEEKTPKEKRKPPPPPKPESESEESESEESDSSSSDEDNNRNLFQRRKKRDSSLEAIQTETPEPKFDRKFSLQSWEAKLSKPNKNLGLKPINSESHQRASSASACHESDMFDFSPEIKRKTLRSTSIDSGISTISEISDTAGIIEQDESMANKWKRYGLKLRSVPNPEKAKKTSIIGTEDSLTSQLFRNSPIDRAPSVLDDLLEKDATKKYERPKSKDDNHHRYGVTPDMIQTHSVFRNNEEQMKRHGEAMLKMNGVLTNDQMTAVEMGEKPEGYITKPWSVKSSAQAPLITEFDEETDLDVIMLMKCLKEDSDELYYLCINNQPKLEKPVLHELFKRIGLSRKVKHVSLALTGINDDDAKLLARHLRYNETLETLNLESNIISIRGMDPLMKSIAKHPALREVKVSNQKNALGGQGEDGMAKAIEQNVNILKFGYSFMNPGARNKADRAILTHNEKMRQAKKHGDEFYDLKAECKKRDATKCPWIILKARRSMGGVIEESVSIMGNMVGAEEVTEVRKTEAPAGGGGGSGQPRAQREAKALDINALLAERKKRLAGGIPGLPPGIVSGDLKNELLNKSNRLSKQNSAKPENREKQQEKNPSLVQRSTSTGQEQRECESKPKSWRPQSTEQEPPSRPKGPMGIGPMGITSGDLKNELLNKSKILSKQNSEKSEKKQEPPPRPKGPMGIGPMGITSGDLKSELLNKSKILSKQNSEKSEKKQEPPPRPKRPMGIGPMGITSGDLKSELLKKSKNISTQNRENSGGGVEKLEEARAEKNKQQLSNMGQPRAMGIIGGDLKNELLNKSKDMSKKSEKRLDDEEKGTRDAPEKKHSREEETAGEKEAPPKEASEPQEEEKPKRKPAVVLPPPEPSSTGLRRRKKSAEEEDAEDIFANVPKSDPAPPAQPEDEGEGEPIAAAVEDKPVEKEEEVQPVVEEPTKPEPAAPPKPAVVIAPLETPAPVGRRRMKKQPSEEEDIDIFASVPEIEIPKEEPKVEEPKVEEQKEPEVSIDVVDAAPAADPKQDLRQALAAKKPVISFGEPEPEPTRRRKKKTEEDNDEYDPFANVPENAPPPPPEPSVIDEPTPARRKKKISVEEETDPFAGVPEISPTPAKTEDEPATEIKSEEKPKSEEEPKSEEVKSDADRPKQEGEGRDRPDRARDSDDRRRRESRAEKDGEDRPRRPRDEDDRRRRESRAERDGGDRPRRPREEGGEDRPRKPREDDDRRRKESRMERDGEDRPRRPREEGSDDKPRRPREEGEEERPRRPREEGGEDRPRKPREDDDRRRRESRMEREGEDRPRRPREEGGEDKPRRPRDEGGEDRPSKPREDDDRRRRESRMERDGEDRPRRPREEGGDDKPRRPREEGEEERPRRPREEGGEDRPRKPREDDDRRRRESRMEREGEDRPRRPREEGGEDRPRRSEDDRRRRESRSDRPPRSPRNDDDQSRSSGNDSDRSRRSMEERDSRSSGDGDRRRRESRGERPPKDGSKSDLKAVDEVFKPEETNGHSSDKKEATGLVDSLFGGADDDAPRVSSMRRRKLEH